MKTISLLIGSLAICLNSIIVVSCVPSEQRYGSEYRDDRMIQHTMITPPVHEPTIDPYQIRRFGLLSGCRLAIQKGDGIGHVLMQGNLVVLHGAGGNFIRPIEPGVKYRLKLRHNGGVDMLYSLEANNEKIISDYDPSTKETNFFFRTDQTCSRLESAK